MDFTHIAQPITINGMTIKNRFALLPMGTDLAATDGTVTKALKDYYEARAKGETGLIIVEAVAVCSKTGRIIVKMLGIDDEKYEAGLKDLVEVLHRHGARASVQLAHGGREAKSWLIGMQPFAPSAVKPPWGEMPREATVEEIKMVIRCFGEAAARAKKCGFDAVEIHAAHEYILNQFLSRATNKRTDEYGGSLENRARMVLEVVKEVREAVGPDYPIFCRINGGEFGIEDGITLEESSEIARMLVKAGVDSISVSAYGWGTHGFSTNPYIPGATAKLAAEIKKVVDVPVIAAGRITPSLGEEILAKGEADIIGLGRALLADPDFPKKVLEDHVQEIRPCIACYNCIGSLLYEHGQVSCTVNPRLGRDGEDIEEAASKKKVWVIGGGPSGMEAARVAALKGHQVVLWEKAADLGGQLIPASLPPFKDPMYDLTTFYRNEMKRLGVEVVRGREARKEDLNEVKPDAVVIACGIATRRLDIPGVDCDKVVNAIDVLLGRNEVGDRVAVIGGGLVGCETGEYIAQQGKKVTILEMLPKMAGGMVSIVRLRLMNNLRSHDVEMLTEIRCEQITSEGLLITDKEGEERLIEADNVIIAVGSGPNDDLARQLQPLVPELYVVGDCREPRDLITAIAEGYEAGMKL